MGGNHSKTVVEATEVTDITIPSFKLLFPSSLWSCYTASNCVGSIIQTAGLFSHSVRGKCSGGVSLPWTLSKPFSFREIENGDTASWSNRGFLCEVLAGYDWDWSGGEVWHMDDLGYFTWKNLKHVVDFIACIHVLYIQYMQLVKYSIFVSVLKNQKTILCLPF